MTPENQATRDAELRKRSKEVEKWGYANPIPETEETDPEKPFRLHQTYDKPGSTRQIRCRWCGSTRFEVGQGSYYTVVRCPECGTEECIHDG